MREVVNQPVSVYFVSDPGTMVRPLYLRWRDRSYKVEQLSHSFSVPQGRSRYHVYCLVADGQYFELVLDPMTMIFLLREVHDGRPD